MYGQNAIAVNEFLGKSWKRVSITFSSLENEKGIGLTFKQYQLISEDIYICYRLFLIPQNHLDLWS